MGFSILSLVEILYFVTLRLACNKNSQENTTKKMEATKKVTQGNVLMIKQKSCQERF